MFLSEKRHITFGSKKPVLPSTSSIRIRKAHPGDLDNIMKYSLKMRQMSLLNELRKEAKDEKINLCNYRLALCGAINGQGLVLVAENCEGFKGFIFGKITESIWSAGTKILEEVGYLADTPKFTYIMLKEYVRIACEMKKDGVIKLITMGDMVGVSPDYSKFGMRLVERKWAM